VAVTRYENLDSCCRVIFYPYPLTIFFIHSEEYRESYEVTAGIKHALQTVPAIGRNFERLYIEKQIANFLSTQFLMKHLCRSPYNQVNTSKG